MGIIQRQAVRSTIITFSGIFVGSITRLIMPVLNVSSTYFGLLSLIDIISSTLTTVFALGFDQVMIKLFPKYRDEENGHNGFLLLGIFISLVGILLAWLVYFSMGDYFLKEDTDADLFRRFSFLIFPLIFCRIIYYNVDSYVRMLYNTVIGTFLESFVSKIVMLFSVVAFALTIVDTEGLVYIYSAAFCVPGLIVIIYAIYKTSKIKLPNPEIYNAANRKEILKLSMFGLLIGASTSIIVGVDNIMISHMISLKAVAYYNLFALAARFILIPGRSLHRIAAVILAEAWTNNDKETVMDIYKKSTVNQLLIGSYLLGLGLVSIAPVMSLSPAYNEYLPYADLFLILGIGFLVEMATGVNMAIIATSKHYAYNTYFNILMAILVIVLNYLLIPKYQLVGCAIASMIAMIVINFLRWFMLFKVYGFQPFDRTFLKAIILSIAFLFIGIFLNYEMNVYLKMIINFVGLSIIFWGIVFYFNLSGDVVKWVKKLKSKYLK